MAILEDLEANRVFSVALRENETAIRFEEECDGYYSHDLSKDELGELIKELQVIHDQMRTNA